MGLKANISRCMEPGDRYSLRKNVFGKRSRNAAQTVCILCPYNRLRGSFKGNQWPLTYKAISITGRDQVTKGLCNRLCLTSRTSHFSFKFVKYRLNDISVGCLFVPIYIPPNFLSRLFRNVLAIWVSIREPFASYVFSAYRGKYSQLIEAVHLCSFSRHKTISTIIIYIKSCLIE